MPLPIKFDGSNVVIAENQPPYIPLPAQFMGDKCGTVLTCWQFSDEERAEFLRTGLIWATFLTFGQPFQPVALATDKPVKIAPEPVEVLTLFGFPAEQMPNEEMLAMRQDEEYKWPKGYTKPGWYFWNLAHDEVFGPFIGQFYCEQAMRAYADDPTKFAEDLQKACECGKDHKGLEPRTKYLEASPGCPGYTEPGWYHCGVHDPNSNMKCSEVFGPFKDQATAIQKLVQHLNPQ
jgi:hypothetical protein